MNHYHHPVDLEHPIGPKAARDAIPDLQSEAIRLSATAAALAAHIRIYQHKVEAALVTLAPEGSLTLDPIPMTTVEVSLQPGEFDTAEAIVNALQEADPDLSVDDCMNEIFTTGLARMAHRLNPT